MTLKDLFVSKKDGSLSITKCAVVGAHVLLFCTVAYVTWHTGEFNPAMWTIYLGATIFHATYDKTMATVTQYKTDRAQEQIGFPPTVPSAMYEDPSRN